MEEQLKSRVEGDINQSEERGNWDALITDQSTKEILAMDARYFLHQSMSTPCLEVVASNKGSEIITHSGHTLLDFHGNNVHQVGYGNELIINRLISQLNQLTFSPRRFTNIHAVQLAKKLAGLLPGDLNRSLFAPGGTLAVGMALKLARVVTGKHKIVALENSFHGASIDSISAGGEEIFKRHMGPLLPGVTHIPAPNSYRNKSNNGDNPEDFAGYLEDAILKEEGDVGAFIAETVRNTDVQIPSMDYWKKVRSICDRYGVLLILDEIPVAPGRTGRMFAFEHYGIEPDIICLGKGLGGGIIPFAAMVTRDKYNIAGDISLGHYTHEKSPLGCVAAISTIEFIENEKILAKVTADAEWFGHELHILKTDYSIIGDVRGIGLLWALELDSNHKTRERVSEKAEKIMYHCLRNGLSFKISRGNILQLSPALTISREELTRALSILDDAFRKNS
jgi:4-aminobutyrate aminotransferase